MKAFIRTLAIKKTVLQIVPVLFLGLVVLSCSQDSIFFNVSIEIKPKDPLIAGSPTNIVVFNNQVFSGTRTGEKIFMYNGSSWTPISSAGGSTGGGLATDGTSLYAGIFPGRDPHGSPVIKKYTGTGWDAIDMGTSGGYYVQSIYGAGNTIFAGGQDKSNYLNYAILAYTSGGSLKPILEGTSFLMGAAAIGTDVYLATAGSGVYKFDSTNPTTPPVAISGTDSVVTGIIETGGVIVVVSSNGGIYTLNPGAGETSFSTLLTTSEKFSGGMCVWSIYAGATGTPTLLLLGVQGQSTSTSTNNGYRELLLDQATGKPLVPGSIKIPGNENPPTSAPDKQAKYEASIGTRAVTAILQAPPGVMPGTVSNENDLPVFASTQRNGLWACRNGEWNAEE